MKVSDEAVRNHLTGTAADERLLNAFFVLYKNARIVERTNRTFVKQCRAFYEAVGAVSESDGDVILKAYGQRYFLNERFVRFSDQSGAGAAITREWRALGIGGVRIDADVSEDDIAEFFSYAAGLSPRGAALEQLQEGLDQRVPGTIVLLSLPDDDDDDDDESAEAERKRLRQHARTNFFRAVSVVEEVMSHTAAEREINLAKTRRVVHSLIDHIGRDKDSLLELAAIKDFDDYTYAHSINVSVYALTLGIRLGMDRPRLSQLGFAALFHDVGKVRLDRDLIRKPDSFDENDWVQMQRHPILGAKTILRNLHLDEHIARAALGAFEHHINSDFTGYPTLQAEQRTPDLFSRIITIADTFDALTSGRVYLKKAIPPDRVLKKMHFQMRQKFDPFLLRVFNDTIGLYPVGTLVLLSTEEIALIVAGNEVQRDRPFLRIVGNRNGLIDPTVWADLSRTEHQHRHILRMIDPERYGLKIRKFVLAED